MYRKTVRIVLLTILAWGLCTIIGWLYAQAGELRQILWLLIALSILFPLFIAERMYYRSNSFFQPDLKNVSQKENLLRASLRGLLLLVAFGIPLTLFDLWEHFGWILIGGFFFNLGYFVYRIYFGARQNN